MAYRKLHPRQLNGLIPLGTLVRLQSGGYNRRFRSAALRRDARRLPKLPLRVPHQRGEAEEAMRHLGIGRQHEEG